MPGLIVLQMDFIFIWSAGHYYGSDPCRLLQRTIDFFFMHAKHLFIKTHGT